MDDWYELTIIYKPSTGLFRMMFGFFEHAHRAQLAKNEAMNKLAVARSNIVPIRPPMIVTRHKSLVDYIKRSIVFGNCDVREAVTSEDIKGRDIIGILPYHLAVHANSMCVLQLDLEKPLGGKNITSEVLRKHAKGFHRYTVNGVEMDTMHNEQG